MPASCWSIIVGRWQIGGGVGAWRRLSLGFDERERETEMRGIREKNVLSLGKKLGYYVGYNRV